EVRCKAFEIGNEFFLVVRKLQRVQKIILEIEQVAENGLLPEFTGRQAPVLIVHTFISPDLQLRQAFQALLKQIKNIVGISMFLQFIQQRNIAEIFLDI